MRKFWLLVLALCAFFAIDCAPLPMLVRSDPDIGWRQYYTTNSPEMRWNTVIMPYYVDQAFSQTRRDQIELAVKQWNWVLNHRFELRFAGLAAKIDDDFVEAHKDFDTRFFIREDATDPEMNDYAGALAFVDEIGGNKIHLIDQRLDFTFMPEIVIMHEIGHSFGLEHTDLADTLMGTHYTEQPHCIDEYTVRTLAAEMSWDWRTLNWCKP